jgi:hypothetical protein
VWQARRRRCGRWRWCCPAAARSGGSPAAVLTRSPLGVASSFTRGGLFRRWGYPARYRQLAAMMARPEFAAFAGVVPDDDPGDLTALARLQVLNTLLVAAALHERPGGFEVIRYETSVLEPAAAHATLARLVPEAPALDGAPAGGGSSADDTFATTTAKDDLVACLDEAGAEEVAAATASALSAGRQAVPGTAWDLARDWAAGDRLYSLAPPAARPRTGAGRFLALAGGCPVSWVPGRADARLRWRNLLVSNDFTCQVSCRERLCRVRFGAAA